MSKIEFGSPQYVPPKCAGSFDQNIIILKPGVIFTDMGDRIIVTSDMLPFSINTYSKSDMHTRSNGNITIKTTNNND